MAVKIPPIRSRIVDDQGYMALEWWKFFEGFKLEAEDTATTANAASTAATGASGDTGVVPGTYGTTTRVGRFTVGSDGRLTSANQSDIAFPVTSVAGTTGATLPPETGWSAPSTLTVSSPPTQAEVQAIESRQRDIINGLINLGLFTA